MRVSEGVRRLSRRAMPQTAAKRWAYVAALAVSAAVGAYLGMAWAIAAVTLIVLLRLADVVRTSRRRLKAGLVRGYFFEGAGERKRSR